VVQGSINHESPFFILRGKLWYYYGTKKMSDKFFSKNIYRKIAELSSLVLMLPSSIAVGLFLGYFLDKLFGTKPWLLLLFTILGMASGFYSLIRGLSKFKNV